MWNTSPGLRPANGPTTGMDLHRRTICSTDVPRSFPESDQLIQATGCFNTPTISFFTTVSMQRALWRRRWLWKMSKHSNDSVERLVSTRVRFCLFLNSTGAGFVAGVDFDYGGEPLNPVDDGLA